MKRLNELKVAIHDEFEKDILGKYAKKNEDGTIFYTNPQDKNSFVFPDEVKAEVEKLEGEFSDKTATIDWSPLNLSELQEVKFSMSELEALGDFIHDDFTETVQTDKVKSIARK